MELAWIEDFLTLAQTQNFTQAAEQRCTTQPAFSRRVQLLEEWLGATLFDRQTRPVQLTAAGEEFFRRAQRMREDILDARRIAMSSKSHYPKVERIYATTAIAVGFIPRWLKETSRVNCSILTSSTGGCLEALRQKRADRIFLPWFADSTPDAQLNYERVAEDNLVLVEAVGAANHLGLKGNVLIGPLMMHAPGSIFGQQVARHLGELKITLESTIACESSSAETMLALVRQGFGVAWIPQSLMDNHVKRCDLPEKLDIPCVIMMITRTG